MLWNNDSKCTLDSKLIKICVETYIWTDSEIVGKLSTNIFFGWMFVD